MNNKRNINRIAIFAASLRGGGAERVLVTLISYLVRQGFEVDMILVTKEGPYLSDLPTGVRVIDLKKLRVFHSLWQLVKYLKTKRPGVIISTMGHVNIVALLARWLARVPTKVVIREVTMVSLSKSYTAGLKSRLIPIAISIFYPMADLIIAVSKGVAEDLICNFRVPTTIIRVIYDPVLDEAMLKKANEAVPHPWFECDHIPVILAAGRLSKEKDYPTLFEAFVLLKELTEVRLVIIGEGQERFKLEKLAQDMGIEKSISMPGFVENPFAFMKNATVFVLSSTVEGLSNVLVQAMAVGTPVVSTNCPSGPAEVLENGKYGPLVPVGDAKSLAEAIYAVINEPPKPEFLQEGALRFSADMICNKYLEAINNIV